MVQTVQDENGLMHEFPDDATPEEMNASFASVDKENRLNKIHSSLSNSPLGILDQGAREFSGGLLNSLVGLVKSGLPKSGQFSPNESAKNFDAYKLLGTEEKRFYTPGGAIQLAGELFMPGKPAASLAKKALSEINPMKFTSGNIAKSILKKEASNKQIASEDYGKIWEKSQDLGLNDLSHSMPEVDFQTISKYSPQKSVKGLLEFSENPTLQNAHNAKSDLLKIQKNLNLKTTLNTAERQHKKAVDEAIDSIEGNMFKNKEGSVNKDLLNEYKKTQNDYRENVVPYTTNKAIQAYKRKELSKKELIESLSKGKFAAQKGEEHPELLRRKLAVHLAKGLGIGGGLLYGGSELYHHLLGGSNGR